LTTTSGYTTNAWVPSAKSVESGAIWLTAKEQYFSSTPFDIYFCRRSSIACSVAKACFGAVWQS
jgi:hypothetical protein